MSFVTFLLMNSPKTGDHRNLLLYIVLAAVALVLIITFALMGKINKKK